MTQYHAVTTCSAEGWDRDGRKMVQSFLKFWPEDISISIFVDGFSVVGDQLYGDRTPRHLMPSWLDEFKARNAAPAKSGLKADKYNYRFDAVKFAHKVAAYTTLALAQDGADETLIWIDADTEFHAPVTHAFLNRVIDHSAYICWLNRDRKYPECGFFTLDLSHEANSEVMHRLQRLYTHGGLFDMAEWHDSYVLQQVIERAINEGLIPLPGSLSGSASNTPHPAINGPLGAILDHKKGDRKYEGRSRPRDLRVKRTEEYWK